MLPSYDHLDTYICTYIPIIPPFAESAVVQFACWRTPLEGTKMSGSPSQLHGWTVRRSNVCLLDSSSNDKRKKMSTKISTDNFLESLGCDGSPVNFFQFQFEGVFPKASYFLGNEIKPTKSFYKNAKPEKLYTDVNVFFAREALIYS